MDSFSAIALILLMALTGYLFAAARWALPQHKAFIVKLIVHVAVPALCISNILNSFDPGLLSDSGALLLAPIGAVVLTMGLAVLLAWILKIDKRRFGGFAVMCGLSNSLFIGYPVCTELFGMDAVPFVMFYYMVNTFVFWTFGYYLLYKSGNSTPADANKESAEHPPLLQKRAL